MFYLLKIKQCLNIVTQQEKKLEISSSHYYYYYYYYYVFWYKKCFRQGVRYRCYVLIKSLLLFYFSLGGLTYSAIVGNNTAYLKYLSIWLKPVAQSKSSQWKRCYSASVNGWASSTFHIRCDYKGPTVTIIRVGKYIFGGYTSRLWGK